MEMNIFFQELLPRLQTIELAGKPERTIGNFVGGPKSVPIRFTLAAVVALTVTPDRTGARPPAAHRHDACLKSLPIALQPH